LKKPVRKWLLPLALIMVIALVFAGCGTGATTTATIPTTSAPATTTSSLTGSFKIIGSNTVTPLSSVWAENFMKANNKVSIAVSGPGSGVGIASLIDGTTDICQSSRLITQAEIGQAKARNRRYNDSDQPNYLCSGNHNFFAHRLIQDYRVEYRYSLELGMGGELHES